MKHYGPITFEPRLVMQRDIAVLVFPTGHYRAFPLDNGIKGAKYRGQRPIAAFYTEPTNQAQLESVCKSIEQCLHPTDRTTLMLSPGDVISIDSHDWKDSFYVSWVVTTDRTKLEGFRVASGTYIINKDALQEPKQPYYYPDGLTIKDELI